MIFLRIVLLLGLTVAFSATASSEQLPIKIYTTTDGLARDRVMRVARDSRGFLWFCTDEGLSRFDGYRFINYTTAEGLPHAIVWDFLETRSGVYWVATWAGLSRFSPSGTPRAWSEGVAGGRGNDPMFVVYRPPEKSAWSFRKLYEDRAGNVWCGTRDGLYRVERAGADWKLQFIDIGAPRDEPESSNIFNLAEDRRGALWIATANGLYRRLPDGRTKRYTTREGLPSNTIRGLLEDPEGRIWVGTSAGLCQLTTEVESNQPIVGRVYTARDGLAGSWINWLFRSSDNRFWACTDAGLAEVVSGADGDRLKFRTYTREHGLSDVFTWSMTEDQHGNFWIGTNLGGAIKLARNGFTTWREEDDLIVSFNNSIGGTQAGEVYLTGVSPAGRFISWFDGERFTPVRINLPKNVTDVGGATHQNNLQDHLGEWWIPTGQGLFRYPKVTSVEQLERAHPKAVYTTRDGLGSDNVYRLFEDRRGDIWISTLSAVPKENRVTRWERATGAFHHYSAADGVPESAASAFCEDASGNLWVGFHNGQLLRYTRGRLTSFTALEGLSAELIKTLYCDHANRLWVGTFEKGVGRIDDPGADQPRFTWYTTAEGLSGSQVWSIAEDRWGRIYLGTNRRLDRLDPATGRIKHYTTADGLAANYVATIYRDRQDALWFSTHHGISRLVPEPDQPMAPPVLISALRIAGDSYPISQLGVAEMAGPELQASQNEIQIDFVGFGLGVGESLRYQFKLKGSNADWSVPTEQRTVNYAKLAPGTYRFLVRAISADGLVSKSPASLSFRVLPPIWQRWWFLTLAAVMVSAVIVSIERYRAARLRELNAALGRSEKLTEVLTAQRAELRKANRSLELEYAATNALADCTTLTTVTPRLLQVICEHTDWEIGALWYVDKQAGVLRCADTWHQPLAPAPQFENRSQGVVFAPGAGLPGRIWQSGEPHWITDLAADAGFPRIAFAVEEGLRSAYGFPILLEAEVIGVLEFFSRETRRPDDEQIKMLSAIGSQIGQLVERKRAEGALRESEDHFRTLTESASDAIITIDAASTITSVNPAAENVFGYETTEMIGRPLTMLMPEYMRHVHRAGIERYTETNQKHTSWSAVELPGLHKTGREIPLEISFCEWTKNGRRFFTGIARDVTERRAAEEALRKTREERLRELERVRTRIATDLHDDIGSSLTQIAILSEVARQKVSHQTGDAAEPLTAITSVSNELVETMSDIVWAINPKKDHLDDLAHRMRRFASDLFTARKIGFRFHSPDLGDDIQLGANVRREVFLIFKESVNNTVKHSGCTEAIAEFYTDDGWLVLKLKDNGRGFDPALHVGDGNGFNSGRGGNGLSSMRRRATELGGSFEITTRTGQGTAVVLRVPVGLQTLNEAAAHTDGDTSA